MSELYTFIGQQLKQARLTRYPTRRVTLQELSKELNVTYQQIQKYEKAVNKIPIENLLKASIYLHKPMSYFIPLHMQYYKNPDIELTPADTDPDVQEFMASKAFV